MSRLEQIDGRLMGTIDHERTRPYLGNGFLELDNNTCERAVKPVAIGRKN
jgi:hypothetical protein